MLYRAFKAPAYLSACHFISRPFLFGHSNSFLFLQITDLQGAVWRWGKENNSSNGKRWVGIRSTD